MAIRLDYTNMLADVVDGGVPVADWQQAEKDFGALRAKVAALRGKGVLGFLDLPGDTKLAESVTTYAKPPAGKFDDVVVLGIGGSALGPIAMRTALLAPNWNTLTKDERKGQPRLHVLDNVDPRTISALLGRLDLRRSLFVVTSKSGGTAETMAQYLVVRERLNAAVGDKARDHLVFITDPKSGALRPLSQAEKITALDIPSNVGGRYSVLTPVGTLPAALVGVDVTAMLAGAADMAARCDADALAKNPGATFAVLQHAADVKKGRHIHILMPYSDPLRDMADWFVQLWAESLGKHRAPGGPRLRTDAARRARRDGSAQPGAAVHGRAAGQDRHVHHRRRDRRRRDDPVAPQGREGARLPWRTPAGRAAGHRAAGDRGCAGAARASEHEAACRSCRRVASGRAVHVSRVRDDPRRGCCTASIRSTSPVSSWGRTSPTRCSAGPVRTRPAANGICYQNRTPIG